MGQCHTITKTNTAGKIIAELWDLLGKSLQTLYFPYKEELKFYWHKLTQCQPKSHLFFYFYPLVLGK